MVLKLEIKKIREEDLDAVLKIEEETFSMPFTREMFDCILGQEPFSGEVAIVDGKLIGYSVYSHVLGEMQLVTIAVIEPFRRQGIAKKLMEAMFAAARKWNAKEIFLEVRSGNEAAQGLYKAFGFKAVGIRKGYYKDNNEDAIVMICNLGDAADEGYKGKGNL